MAAPETKNAQNMVEEASTEAGAAIADSRKAADKELVALNRVSVPIVFVACLGLLVAVVGLFTDNFHIALGGTSLVAAGALAWVVAASIVIWKMAAQWFGARRNTL